MSSSLPSSASICLSAAHSGTLISFRHERVALVPRAHHTAPAGPACLNNNAPHRRGRPSPLASAPRTFTPGRRALRRAEAAASRARARAAVTATDAEQAQILALIAASEAQHVVTLDAL